MTGEVYRGKPWPPAGRIPCLVIGCRRTAAVDRYPPHTEIICGKCFRLAPTWMRRRLRRIERIMARLDVKGWDAPGPPLSPARRALILHHKAWTKLVTAATNSKLGIGP